MRDATHLLGDPRLSERFWSRVDVQSCGCWLWTGAPDCDNYPNRQRTGLPHPGGPGHGTLTLRPVRWAYTALVGPVPDGQQIGHQCHSLNLDTCPGGTRCAHRMCVNPLDVEPETPAENLQGGHTFQRRNALVEHCPQRHWYTPENTMMVGPRKANRACRKCYRNAWRIRHNKSPETIEGPDF